MARDECVIDLQVVVEGGGHGGHYAGQFHKFPVLFSEVERMSDSIVLSRLRIARADKARARMAARSPVKARRAARRGQGRGDAQALMAGGEPQRRVGGRRADQRQFVGRGGAKAGPDANALNVARAGSRAWRACSIAVSIAGSTAIFVAVLARRADEDLPGLARLHVEGDRVGGDRVRAFQIAELDELMANEARIAVGDDQMAFALLHGMPGVSSRSPAPRR